MQKKPTDQEDIKSKNMIKKSNESRNSVTGYMEQGNPGSSHAKSRAMNNNSNR